MRVLHLGKFYPPVRGGIETATFELVEGLVRRGVAVDVLCANTRLSTGREWRRVGDDRYRVVRAASAGQWLSLSLAPGLIPELRAQVADHDLVHVHMPDPLAALALRLARPASRVVLHWHSDVVRQRLALRLYEPLQRWLLSRADAVIATSQAYAASGTLAGWAHKVRVVPLGTADPALRLQPERLDRVRRAHEGRRLVVALGRFAWYKGFDVLVRAAAQLPSDVRVLIAGDGPMRPACAALVKALKLEDRVQLPGEVDDAEVPALLAAADVFCQPSTTRAEAFGLAIVEAMAMARPVVCSAIPGSGMSWINHDGLTGLLVPPDDPAALADALRRLLSDGAQARRLGAAARRRYEQELRADLMVDRVLRLYRELW